MAAVTAGWQEREAEVEEMREHLGRPVANLRLYARAEQLFAQDRELAALYRERQDVLRQLQDLYRVRLAHILRAARDLASRLTEPSLVEPEREAVMTSLRALDDHHLGRLRAVHEEFDAKARPLERPALLRHRHEIAKQLGASVALAIAGGHVAVLLNRLRLFGVVELAARLPIFAWSAGAMVLGSKVVLFHDSPPQGAGDAEVVESGLHLYDDLIPLPHASKRLRLDDPVRVSLFARRFAPARCVAFEPKVQLVRKGGAAWRPSAGVQKLGESGNLEPMRSA
ncbi:MAG TPA: hypothetical protein PK413_11510 [Thermoanaerobaculia bacterium]|nr:hypothetical protein [Thermoanaerobaculia bacterium]